MRIPLACALILAIAAAAASAQTFRGGIQGTVLDQTGAALPGVTITVTSIDTGLTRMVQTDVVALEKLAESLRHYADRVRLLVPDPQALGPVAALIAC